ncbi:25013_t:CDS:2 [Cetraspora pellucida]|uniref:Peroxisomal membrane protein PEX14 n=1 Tax=Cetraspora pellucida TaxID=1433469 RepID=A0A9N9BKC4_9GLOM|nr:25013_t:CDS:2 [Cetraspora pellucida]
MSTSRQSLITSAVNFLKDPNVQSSPLQKRVAFLESKGLTSEEIEEALKKSKGDDISTNASEVALPKHNQANVQSSGQPIVIQPPPVPRMDWKDYFIAAVFIGGIGYAIVAVTKKYITPLLRLPTADELDRDKQLLTDQFTTASETLDTAKLDIQLVKKSIEEQSFKLLEKTKESQSQSLSDLQQELKSLKSLLANRRTLSNDVLPSSPTSTLTPTSPIVQSISSHHGITSDRPTIPTWQLTSTASKDPLD